MKKIGISIYPEKADFASDSLYITKAAEFGFSRLFISLLEISGEQDDILLNFKKIIHFAKEKGFEVILDVNPAIFQRLQISYADLSFFANLGADGIRLDLGFSGVEEAAMTHNPYNLLIEINMSHGTNYLENIISRRPRTGYLIGSHNFYPHEFTGLDFDYFEKCSEKFRKQNIPTAAFINAPSGTYGPWPMQEGICTLESHRHLSIETQAAHLLFSDLIDCVIIGNAYASVLMNTHIYRGEVTPYVYRTKSEGRKKYAEESLPPHRTSDIFKGDILIDNDLYLQYKGELQIAKKDRPKNEKVNVVGKVVDEDLLLLASMKPWTSFHLVAAD